MPRPLNLLPASMGLTILMLAISIAPGLAQTDGEFRVQILAFDANEGCAIADYDGDGRLDVSAGRMWYRNGDWLPRPVRAIEDRNGFTMSNGEHALDVNGDGLIDILGSRFFTPEISWFENLGPESILNCYLWPEHVLVDTGNTTNEYNTLHDLDGDGTPEMISNQWNPSRPLYAWRFATERREEQAKRGNEIVTEERDVKVMKGHLIGNICGHGLGFGDINNDGREDILVGKGWYERPEGDIYANSWTFHDDWDLHMSCPVLIRDIDGDGLNDLIWSTGHDYGLFLWKGQGPDASGRLQFESQEIDSSISQLHGLHFADLDGDGIEEIITGKRIRAHNGKDPGSTDEPILVSYSWNAETQSFTKRVINRGRVGMGLQIRTADIDADGDLDIVVAGKDGTQILYNPNRS